MRRDEAARESEIDIVFGKNSADAQALASVKKCTNINSWYKSVCEIFDYYDN